MLDFIKNIPDTWYIWIAIGTIIGIGFYCIKKFASQPKEEQIKKVKEWLIYATSLAEKTLGGGTGVLKLRYVYDMFLGKFPSLASILTFEAFSNLVDEALVRFKQELQSNEKIQEYVEGGDCK